MKNLLNTLGILNYQATSIRSTRFFRPTYDTITNPSPLPKKKKEGKRSKIEFLLEMYARVRKIHVNFDPESIYTLRMNHIGQLRIHIRPPPPPLRK